MVQLRRLRLPVIVVLLLVAVPVGWAADLPVSVISVSSPVAPFSDATLEIQTVFGAVCGITVRYKSGPSRAKGLVPESTFLRFNFHIKRDNTPGIRPDEGAST